MVNVNSNIIASSTKRGSASVTKLGLKNMSKQERTAQDHFYLVFLRQENVQNRSTIDATPSKLGRQAAKDA